MGLIFNTLMLGVGLGVGYVLWHPTMDNCGELYNRKISVMEEKYTSVPRNEVIGPREVSIDYVVNEKEKIKGLVITHKRSGEKGILVERPALFKGNYHLELELLDKPLKVDEKIPLVGMGAVTSSTEKYTGFAEGLVDKIKDYAAQITK